MLALSSESWEWSFGPGLGILISVTYEQPSGIRVFNKTKQKSKATITRRVIWTLERRWGPTDGFVCTYRRRQITTFMLVLNHSSCLYSVGISAVWFVTWTKRSGVQWNGQKNWAVSFPATKVSLEDQTWMSAVCSVTAPQGRASPYHVTWPLVGEDKWRPQVTPITLSPSSCYFYGAFVFPSQLDCSHCRTTLPCVPPGPPWLLTPIPGCGIFPSHASAVLWPQLGVLHFNSILAVWSWR